jgi:hypothetical protein
MDQPTIRMLCSDISHMALLSVWRDSGVTQQQGFELITHIANADVPGQPRVELSERAEKVLGGEYEFMSGLHHQTYEYRARGDKRFVYLAQAQDNWDDKLVVAPEIDSLQDLAGKRVIVTTSAPCVFGNLKRALEMGGLDPATVEFDVWREQGTDVSLRAVHEVIAGDAAGANVDVPFDLYATKRSLKWMEIPELPVVHNITVCSNRDWVTANEELTHAFLRSMIAAIHFFKTQPDAVCEILESTLAPLIGIEDEDEVRHLQSYWAEQLNVKPYPHPMAIWNVYQLDILHKQDMNHVGPLEIWDTGYLRDVDDSGFIEELYAAAPAPAPA